MDGGLVLELTDTNFDEQIQANHGPILVDFWASWCGPCKKIAPALNELARELYGSARVAKVNVDENEDLASRFCVRSIPMLVVFKDGRIVDQMIGAVPKDEIRRLLQKHF